MWWSRGRRLIHPHRSNLLDFLLGISAWGTPKQAMYYVSLPPKGHYLISKLVATYIAVLW